jgi:hypothetical protein
MTGGGFGACDGLDPDAEAEVMKPAKELARSLRPSEKVGSLSGMPTRHEILPALLGDIDGWMKSSPRASQMSVDPSRVEIINRLLELLAEESPSDIGVLQSTIVSMFTSTYSVNLPAFFYTPEEIDDGCAIGPSEPLSVAIEVGIDDRLMVTIETFEAMVAQISTNRLARLLDAYKEYVQAMEMAWQVAVLENQPDGYESAKIQNAAGIAVWGEYAYVADSTQHVIFRVNLTSDEITYFCGERGKPGWHDGPREMATFNSPSGLALCEGTSSLYVCDTGNDSIRIVSVPDGRVCTLSLSSESTQSVKVLSQMVCL